MKTSTSFLKLLMLSWDRSGFTIASFQRNIHMFEPEKVQFEIVPLLDLLENKHVSITSGIHEENMRNSQAFFFVFTFVKMKVYILSFPCFESQCDEDKWRDTQENWQDQAKSTYSSVTFIKWNDIFWILILVNQSFCDLDCHWINNLISNSALKLCFS